MKKTKTLTIVILICLIFFGVITIFVGDGGEKQKEYENALVQAKDYLERGMYQLAIGEYEKAIAIADSEELRTAVLDAYEKRYEESTSILDSYILAAQSAVSIYSNNPEYYLVLANVYLRNDDYQAAYKTLNNALNNGVNDEEVSRLYLSIKYAFDTDWYTYTDFLPATEGVYPVMNSEMWGYIDETGSGETDFDYSFVSQVGDEGIRVLADEQILLVDSSDVVRGKLSFVPMQAGIYSEGLIAINNGENFGYYNSLGDYQFGNYIAAGSFKNGKAAVALKEDLWSIVDITGKIVSDKSYQNIRLNLDGSYLYNDIMLAKENGKYKIYQEENPIGNFECDDIDVVTSDELIAFKSNGKWGFVNTKAEVIIKPTYDQAKSFSNGLAAVCVDGKWGFVDELGNIVIECQFYDVDYFNSERHCMVQTTTVDWQMISLKVNF